MPLPPEVYQELIARRAAEYRQAQRDSYWALLRTVVHIACWTGCGLFLIGLAWHTTDEGFGRIFWYGGMAVWLAGVFTALHLAKVRAEERGD